MQRIKDRLTYGIAFLVILLIATASVAFGQNPSSPSATPPPTPQRGLGIQSAGSANASQAGQQAREAKPELVLQTGYNNFFGATRLVFSPDGRLLATATFRSSTIKLWETATGRELRNLSSGRQSAIGMSPFIAFSGDSRFAAAAAGENSVKVWDVTSGREVQTLTSGEGGVASALVGVYFIAFSSNDQIITISDAVRVWDVPTGKELRTIATNTLNGLAFVGGEGGAALSLDGTQLARVSTDGETQVKFLDLATGRETRSVKLTDEQIESAELAFTPDGHLLVSGIVDKGVKLWDVTNKANERDLGSTAQDWSLLKFSRDGRLLALTEGYQSNSGTLLPVTICRL